LSSGWSSEENDKYDSRQQYRELHDLLLTVTAQHTPIISRQILQELLMTTTGYPVNQMVVSMEIFHLG
jgi:hypothetical protein